MTIIFFQGFFLEADKAGDILEINLDADYTRAIEDIDVSTGLIQHGDNLLDKQMIENFKNFVFSPRDQTTPLREVDFIDDFKVFPNPSTDGNLTIVLQNSNETNYDLVVVDLTGREVYSEQDLKAGLEYKIHLEVPGAYMVSMMIGRNMILNRRILVD